MTATRWARFDPAGGHFPLLPSNAGNLDTGAPRARVRPLLSFLVSAEAKARLEESGKRFGKGMPEMTHPIRSPGPARAVGVRCGNCRAVRHG